MLHLILLPALLLLVLTNITAAQNSNVPPRLVGIESGIIRGSYMLTKNGRRITAFQSIPYAKPPLGKLRFMPPSRITPWFGVLNTTSIHTVCPQINSFFRSETFEGDENCLYLNVYTPKLPSKSTKTLLPVMVFFHGGGFYAGGGNSLLYNPGYLLDKDIVLLGCNYRLGALGFLTTGDRVLPGNLGLKDQNFVLQWVQRNIAKFGGDPNSVTIFGESAGGASVYYHILSPMSRGLFHKAIAESGTPFDTWAFNPRAENLQNSFTLAKSLNCPIRPSKKMVECLRKLDASDLVKKDVIFQKWDTDPIAAFNVVIEPKHEGAFLSDHPENIIKSGNVAPIPVLTGVNTDDGSLRSAVLALPELFHDLQDDTRRVLPITLMYDAMGYDLDNITNKILDFYFPNGVIRENNTQEVIDMYSDALFISGADKTVRLQSQFTNATIYYYLFAHRGRGSFSEFFTGSGTNYGVCHVDELLYLFPIGDLLYPDRKITPDDERMVQILTTLWTDFARTGNPTPDLRSNDLKLEKWIPYKNTPNQYYYIDAKKPRMTQSTLLNRMKFWRDLDINHRQTI